MDAGALTSEAQAEGHGIEGLVREFRPLVRSIARRYEGRGADREDLEQEGYLALILLARRGMGRDPARHLKNHLPGFVRDAAARMRHRSETVTLTPNGDDDDSPPLAEMLPDERAERDFEEFELHDLMERTLTREEFHIAGSLYRGMTQSEIASSLGRTQQSIGWRLKGIRSKLKKVS